MSASSTSHPASKTEELVALLRCRSGRMVADLAIAMNWKPHMTRAALTRLRQAGWTIDKLDPAANERAARYRLGQAS